MSDQTSAAGAPPVVMGIVMDDNSTAETEAPAVVGQVSPQCSFCETHRRCNESEYREWLQFHAYSDVRLALQGERGVAIRDPSPATMLPVPFHDERRLAKILVAPSYIRILTSDGQKKLVCDECHTEFPGVSSKQFDRNAAIRAMTALYPHLQLYMCKYCTRKVCSDCIHNGLHTQEGSRFKASDGGEWKTGLLDCLVSPQHCCNVLFCYYAFSSSSASYSYKLALDRVHMRAAFKENDCTECLATCAWNLFNVFFGAAFYMLSDLSFCTSTWCVCPLEDELHRRYGLTKHSRLEWLLCRHCIFARLMMEAEARGFHQPTYCSCMSLREALSRIPPLDRRAVTKVLNDTAQQAPLHQNMN